MKKKILFRWLTYILFPGFLLIVSVSRINAQGELSKLTSQVLSVSDERSGDTVLVEHIRSFLSDVRTAELVFVDTSAKSYAELLKITSMVDLKAVNSGKTDRFIRSLEKAEKELHELIKSSPYADLQVLIVPHSHADLSWPDTPEVCTNLNVQAISESISILKDLPDFRFSEEDVFVFQEFLRRYPAQTETVTDLLHKNILECGSFYMGPSELLLGGEGLVRNLYFGKRWLQENFGYKSEFAWNVDEPGHTLQMPQILVKAGIRNFVIWKVLVRPENNLNVSGYAGPAIFRWQSPDGSNIMVTHCPQGYGAGHLLRTKNYSVAEDKFRNFVQKEISQLIKWDLPPVILMADGSDCTIPDEMVGINAKKWNEKYSSPKATLASLNDYFTAVEKEIRKGNGKIQTITGEIPSWWDGTQSVENDAFMLSRHAEQLVTAAEKFSSLNDLLIPGYEYQRTSINNVWQGKLWVHEHNWGGHNGAISDAVKLARARESYRLADDLLSGTMDALVLQIRCSNEGIPIIVFNSLTWQRTDIVDHVVTFPDSGIKDLHLLDNKGKEIPLQFQVQARHPDGSIARVQVVFEASVPSLGYLTYYLVPGSNRTITSLTASKAGLENQFYKIIVDSISGGISGIYDKLNSKEILNTGRYKGNELIALQNLGVDEAEEFTENIWHMNEETASVTLIESGPVRATIGISGSILNSGCNQEISLYNSIPRIDLKTVLDWDGKKEIQVNVTYPFNIEMGSLSYEVPFGTVQYGRENPYAIACHPTVRATNNWIDLSNEQMGVTLATEVTPFDVKDRMDKRFHDARIMKGVMEPDSFSIYYKGLYRPFERISFNDPVLLKTDFVIQPVLLRSVFSCGDRNLYFTQEGIHPYRFAIQTHKGSLIPHEAARLGWEHNSPLIVRRGQSLRGDLPDSHSFLEVSVPDVLVTILKKAEDGNGLLLRCYEADGLDSRVTIKCPEGVVKAMMTNIIEEDQKVIPVNTKGEIEFNIGKYAIETIRLIYN